MCGIVGYIGTQNAVPYLIEGLSKLEYRGYDSAGIAINIDNQLKIFKTKGRLKNLEEILDPNAKSVIGIGHTRWATHGAPSNLNAHPHLNQSETIAVIHNGIIENYMEIKEWLIKDKKVTFKSETDSEVIAHLVDYFYEGDLLDAVYKAVDRMIGAYAIGVISKDEPNRLVAVRKDSPLIVGLGENENFIASDIPALLKYTRNMLLIENDEFVDLTKDKVTIYNSLRQPVEREVFKVTWDIDSAEKEGFEHFTLKEIFEQPKGVKETVLRRLNNKDEIVLEGVNFDAEILKNINKIYIVACGTAYHAGLIGRRAIEQFAKIPVECDVASEFRYRDPFVDDKTLFIAVSQSGETLDTLQSLREAKRKGARILSIVNVVGSSVARESDDLLYTWAGPEIGVASTKAYTTQLTAFYLLALYMGKLKGSIEEALYKAVINGLKTMPDLIQEVLDKGHEIQKLAAGQFNNEKVFFMGRGVDCDLAYEGSLKLKEISYINSFAIAAGELKHGTIALIEDETFVVALATQEKLYDKMLSNIKEVKARGAHVFAIAQAGNDQILKTSDEVFFIPRTMDELAPILAVVPTQLLAYYVSALRGNDVDKPRNLAKSVTVE
ncbi:MAG: glutamine--fructose-6-phosphate aminotransferase [Clostridiales bacterium 38-18]|nr:MAG: glutamine--fructose-6-phosphate aminotransferase [Clostridiales bacterium 38-18]